MNHDERLLSYRGRKAVRSGQLIVLSEDNRLLTPAQRRRLKHKENGRKTHSHADLPTVEVNGHVRRVPCWRCSKLTAKHRLGGDG